MKYKLLNCQDYSQGFILQQVTEIDQTIVISRAVTLLWLDLGSKHFILTLIIRAHFSQSVQHESYGSGVKLNQFFIWPFNINYAIFIKYASC